MNRFSNSNDRGRLKGQFFSYDAIVAGLLFILLLTLLYTYWNSLRSTISVKIDDVTRIAMDASNLLMTPGFPNDWTSGNYNQIGLTADYNSIVIDGRKVESLRSITPDMIRQKLAVSPYYVYIEVGELDPIGYAPDNALSKVTIKRPVILDDELVNLSITVWSSLS